MPVQCINNDRIYETSVTTGVGDYTLAGAATGFQPVSVIGASNYGMFHITDDTNWEVILGTYITGPSRLQRTAVLASSNAGAAVNWGAGTRKIRCGLPAGFSLPVRKSKSVAGAANVTLTAVEQRCNILELTGVLTGSINVIVDETVWAWTILNNTSGAFTVTVKTSGGTGITVPQGKRALLHCDGTNVVNSQDGVIKAWALVTVAAGTPTLTANQNVSSVSDNGVGQFTINFFKAFASASYAVAGFSRSATGDGRALCCQGSAETRAAGSCGVAMSNSTTASYADHESFSVVFFGDQ